ncbi:mechanosensitive ion channel family protein [Sphingomonas solaris]|uniref:Mechanosensitive ion channel family protein n=1 Tax=Alterirhizorhabdus solaris TaxID=2529389 RepID=A0A558QV59_9SPHN|nr:mechanosensitive ion channel domain-containing protein [Sphingomonas solaris]TVV71030.1 mechanosensitive ion channel family protein [Sphingomonas solaris]
MIGLIGAFAPAAAQTTPDDWRTLGQWRATAARAEALLDLPLSRREHVTADQWEDLRLNLTVQRELALDLGQRGTLKGRIAQAQLAQLDDDTTKPQEALAWVKQKRIELGRSVAQEQAPAIAARDVYARDGVLIHEIDLVLRQKRRQKLFAHDRPILLPATWVAAAEDVRSSEMRPATAAATRQPYAALVGVPLAFRIALVVAAAAVAVWAGVRWRRSLRAAIDRRSIPAHSPRSRLGLAFARDLLDILIPAAVLMLVFAGVSLLTADLPFLVASSGQVILAGLAVIYARWLGQSLFAPAFPAAQLLRLPDDLTDRAIRLMTALGLVVAADQLVDYFERQPGSSAAVSALLSFAVVVVTSLLIWRLARILRNARGARSVKASTVHPDDAGPDDAVRTAARFMTIAAGLAGVAALVGYVALARYLLTSTLISLATVCTTLFLYRSITEASELLFGHRERAPSRYLQLLPLIFGFALSVLTLPIVAVAWGISPERIVDGILALKNGVAIGQIRLSFGSVMTFALVFLIGYALTRWLQRVLHYAVLDRLRIEAGARAAVLTGFGYLGLTLAAVVAFTAAGLDLSSLAFIAGALSVGVGFGLQPVVANFVSGIILLIERPIKVGDWIEVGAYSGHVRRIAFRSTHIETFDRHEVIIPNSDLISGSVTNLTYAGSLGRITLPVGIAYDSDLEAARTLLLKVLTDHDRVLDRPEPSVVLDSLGDSAINLKAMCFVENVNQRLSVRSDLYFAILKALDQAGITIPLPQRELWIRTGDGARGQPGSVHGAISANDGEHER